MASIVDIAGDRRLQLGAEEFARSFVFGSKWQCLTLCFRFALAGSGGGAPALNNNMRFRFGICVGATNTYYSTGTTYWLGVDPNGFNNATWWNYNAGGGTPYIEGYNSQCYTEYRTGNTTTRNGLDSPTNGAMQYMGTYDGLGGNTRSFWAMNIYRQGSFFQINTGSNSYQSVQANYCGSDFEMFRAAEAYSGGFGGFTYAVGLTGITVPSPYHLQFDTFSILWNSNTAPLQFSDIFVLRKA